MSLDAIQPPRLESLNTIPFPVSPTTDLSHAYSAPLWFSSLRCENSQGALFFHEEILAFARWVTPNRAECAWRNEIVERLSVAVRSLWPAARLQVYGSTLSGLATPQSDIDVVIENANAPEGELKFHILADKLHEDGISLGRPIIAGGSRVPVLKMIDQESSCLVDVSFHGHVGPANTQLVMRFLDKFPLARPLALVIKYYLKQKSLNDTYHGGIGSYTLVLLVISFMQRYYSEDSDNKNPHNLASMLCAFFELYGCKFDYSRYAISVLNGGQYIPKEEKGWVNPDMPQALAVEDPLLPEMDVGASSFNIDGVRASFVSALEILVRGPVYIYSGPPQNNTGTGLAESASRFDSSGNTNNAYFPHLTPNGVSFLRRLINVPAREKEQRKKIREKYPTYVVKSRAPLEPVASDNSSNAELLRKIEAVLSVTASTSTQSKRRRKKDRKKPRFGGRSEQSGGSQASAAGACSAAASFASTSDGSVDGDSSFDISSGASSVSGSNGSESGPSSESLSSDESSIEESIADTTASNIAGMEIEDKAQRSSKSNDLSSAVSLLKLEMPLQRCTRSADNSPRPGGLILSSGSYHPNGLKSASVSPRRSSFSEIASRMPPVVAVPSTVRITPKANAVPVETLLVKDEANFPSLGSTSKVKRG